MTTEQQNAERYTPHPLFFEDDGFIYADASEQRQADGLSCLRIADPHCDGGPDIDEREANAQRLVACWNACQDIPTAALKSRGLAGIITLARAIASPEIDTDADPLPDAVAIGDFLIRLRDQAREELDRIGVQYAD